MPIFKPGQKFRYHKILSKKGGKREVVALLSLTAMVDMFTVLVIFLLQNYNATGQVIFIPKEVVLPQAERIKELKPAVVVTISPLEVLIERDRIILTDDLKKQESWMIQNLFAQLKVRLAKAKEDYEKNIKNKISQVMNPEDKDLTPWNKVTIQADKGVDFLTVKKIMYTVTEAGAGEINFAVSKDAAAK